MKTDPPGKASGFVFFLPDSEGVLRALPRYLATTLILSAGIALLISLTTNSGPRVFTNLPADLLISNCIGLSVFAVLTIARLTFVRRFSGGSASQKIIYFALVATGALLGNELAYELTRRTMSGFGFLRAHNGIVAVVFAFLAAMIAIGINTNRLTRAQHKRDLERAERTAIEAQLRALQAQIEPHFLFNTLANLDALISTDPASARNLLANLNRYLRAALTHARSDTATLQTEVELLKAYLAIMALRLPNRLTTQFDCDPQCLRLGFPAMLVQPLVENAITHGIEPAAEGGTINVSVRRSSDMLLISVDDTGVGLGNAVTAGSGAGIQNIRARLRSLFGAAAELTIEPRSPRGTHASIQVPLRLLSEVAT
jgi:sensor histidine kinase YesM